MANLSLSFACNRLPITGSSGKREEGLDAPPLVNPDQLHLEIDGAVSKQSGYCWAAASAAARLTLDTPTVPLPAVVH